MKPTSSIAVILALVLILLPGVAGPEPMHDVGGGVTPMRDLAVGGGMTSTDIFNISAHSAPPGHRAAPGEGVYGHLRAKNVRDYPQPFIIEGQVTCLNVVGNRATLGGVLTHFESTAFPNPDLFHGFLFHVEDNGNQQGDPDKISFEFILVNPPASCPNPNPALTIFPLLHGNIVVRSGGN